MLDCFIRKNDKELRERLWNEGIFQNDQDDDMGDWIAYNYGLFISVYEGYDKVFPDAIDCGTDEDLFIETIKKG